MTDGSSFGYVVDISNSSPIINTINYDGLYSDNLNYVKFTCVDDVFIIYKYNECKNNEISKSHYIRIDDPSTVVSMSMFDTSVSSYIGGRIDFMLRYIQCNKDSSGNDSGTLCLLITRGFSNNSSSTPNGSDNRIIDFGQYLSTGEVHSYVHSLNSNLGNYILYGENIINGYNKIPLMNYMPIKLTGKTDTITSFNKTKNIANKSWLISYTNNPTWGYEINGKGVPPGSPLVSTNKDGEIIAWAYSQNK